MAIKFPNDILINVIEVKNYDYFLPIPPPKKNSVLKSLPILFLSPLVTRKGKFFQFVEIKFANDILIIVFETKNDDYFLPMPPLKEIQF